MLGRLLVEMLSFQLRGTWELSRREIVRATGNSSAIQIAADHFAALSQGNVDWLTHYIPPSFWLLWVGLAACGFLARPLALALDTRRVLLFAHCHIAGGAGRAGLAGPSPVRIPVPVLGTFRHRLGHGFL